MPVLQTPLHTYKRHCVCVCLAPHVIRVCMRLRLRTGTLIALRLLAQTQHRSSVCQHRPSTDPVCVCVFGAVQVAVLIAQHLSAQTQHVAFHLPSHHQPHPHPHHSRLLPLSVTLHQPLQRLGFLRQALQRRLLPSVFLPEPSHWLRGSLQPPPPARAHTHTHRVISGAPMLRARNPIQGAYGARKLTGHAATHRHTDTHTHSPLTCAAWMAANLSCSSACFLRMTICFSMASLLFASLAA